MTKCGLGVWVEDGVPISLVIYAPTLHHTTPLASVLFALSRLLTLNDRCSNGKGKVLIATDDEIGHTAGYVSLLLTLILQSLLIVLLLLI